MLFHLRPWDIRCTILKTLRTSEKIALEIKRSLENGKN